MEALFVGQTYIDVTFLADRIPTGDEKDVARDYAVSFGGNAVTAAFCCARLGIAPDLLTSVADDWLGRMFLDMAARYQVCIHPRKVRRSSLSFVMPKGGKRAIVRCRDDEYLHPFPPLNLSGCRALHLDGHQADAALHYARECRKAGILTSLDGGGVRVNTIELLEFIDIAVVSERFCDQLRLSSLAALELLKKKGCKIGGVTMGERGMLWYDETGKVSTMPALYVPPERNRRHQWRRRRVPRLIYLFVSHASESIVGDPFPLCTRRLGLCHPFSWQRSAAAAPGRRAGNRGALTASRHP